MISRRGEKYKMIPRNSNEGEYGIERKQTGVGKETEDQETRTNRNGKRKKRG